ncbi:hypothetical protein P280DRAFT_516516 [Massarina eburnea CBS 473.64]|uniref:Uncharacterized protein n=1 Tax=Massarina eburnea CBS 473.64 TaxID=1395130 RepID=A0A6A6S4V6_9PLEO|nr:hypothetical protein P280DRAFT_516516 [Massarina eburnea CBS 473.64]
MAACQPAAALSPRFDLCPPPLHIRKKTRRATFYRRILHKSSRSTCFDTFVYGPLDDIISEISGDIWRSPAAPGFEDWSWNPLKAPSTCIVTPLPVSRIPSDQPLIVRKNRSSRSTASGSSAGKTMASSSGDSHQPQSASAQKASITSNEGSQSDKRGGSIKDLLKGKWRVHRASTADSTPSSTPSISEPSRLRRTGTADASRSITEPSCLRRIDSADTSRSSFSRTGIKIANKDDAANDKLAYPKNEFKEHFADGLPPIDPRSRHTNELPTLKAEIKVTSESRILNAEPVQDLWVSVEVTGTQHNRQEPREAMVDVAFVVDNGYYVSKECLERALNTVMKAFYTLKRGDRLAIYTTHCTHYGAVTSTTPDVIYPLRAVGDGTQEILRELTREIEEGGRQSWNPPRPNPAMTEVVLAVSKSLDIAGSKTGQTHVIVLSPKMHVLHKVLETFPRLHVHQINPAVLPYRHSDTLRDHICPEACCENVFVNNWSHYQVLGSTVEQIILNARSEKPHGSIENLHADYRLNKGCEVLEVRGSKDIDSLRLGQTHNFFVHLRVTRSETKEIDLDSSDPVLNSSLDATYTRQNLRNVKTAGGSMVHLMSIQLTHQNSLHAHETWIYTESHLLLLKDLGRMLPPPDRFIRFHKRHLHYKLSRLDPHDAHEEVESLSSDRTDFKDLVERMTTEIRHQEAVLRYEERDRQRLPMCPGPIAVPFQAHEWLVATREEKRNRRRADSAK